MADHRSLLVMSQLQEFTAIFKYSLHRGARTPVSYNWTSGYNIGGAQIFFYRDCRIGGVTPIRMGIIS